VTDRNVPIAPIVPYEREDYDAERLRLAAQGRLRLGSGEQLGDDFWNSPAPRISARSLLKAIDEDRKED
jgi:antitoxin (DNA-binding transcriptional repressor) of toxin-antitoxin stability system